MGLFMFKKSVFIFLFALLFSGCAELGALLHVPSSHKTISKTSKTKTTQNIPKLVLHNSREDTLQKSISGTLIVIIGLILVF